VVAISEQTKQDLVELMEVPEEKIKVVYQTCDSMFWNMENENLNIEAAHEKYHLPDKYIVCVGTIEERKNQLCAIRAIQRLPEEIGLVIVGRPRGKYGQEALREANDRIRIVTHADFADFPAIYRGSLASVYISRFEGFGIPVLESMCCDTPVVTSGVSSMPEAGGEAALYANPDDDAAVAEHLLRLATNEAFRQECIEKGRIQKKRFAPERVAQDMIEVYRSFGTI
jgi:glycosyltransferase involved in cell wall biosynthesis